MIAAWVTQGAQIGITAFIAVFCFAWCIALIVCLVHLLSSAIGGVENDKGNNPDRGRRANRPF